MSNFLTLTTPGTLMAFGPEYIFNLGCPFQPITTPPAQPCYGWNTYQNLYSRYIVEAVEIDVEFTGPSGPLFVGAIVQSSNNTFTFPGHSLDDSPAWPGCYVTTLNPTGSQTARLVQRMKNNELEGLSPSAYNGAISVYSAAMNAVPPQQPFLRVAAASGALAGESCNVLVKLAYHVLLYDRAQNNLEP